MGGNPSLLISNQKPTSRVGLLMLLNTLNATMETDTVRRESGALVIGERRPRKCQRGLRAV